MLSEEERLKLEMKFNEMVQKSREEEQVYYRRLRSQYKKFLEEDRKRQERNEKIVRTLERIETRIDMLTSKTERIKNLRKHYHNYLQRVSGQQVPPKVVINTPQYSTIPKNTTTCNEDVFPTNNNCEDEQKLNDEKMEILDRYLQSISSQKCRDLLEKRKMENAELDKLEVLKHKLEYGFDSNKAQSIAEDIMNSIYSRHYNKDPNQGDRQTSRKANVKFSCDVDDDNKSDISDLTQSKDGTECITQNTKSDTVPSNGDKDANKQEKRVFVENEQEIQLQPISKENKGFHNISNYENGTKQENNLQENYNQDTNNTRLNEIESKPECLSNNLSITNETDEFVEVKKIDSSFINNQQENDDEDDKENMYDKDHSENKQTVFEPSLADNQSCNEDNVSSVDISKDILPSELPVQENVEQNPDLSESTQSAQQQHEPNSTALETQAKGECNYDSQAQYSEDGQPLPYESNDQEIQYDQHGQPLQYDENDQIVQYSPNGVSYDENGQPIQYDENGQPLPYNENGQDLHYDGQSQPIQYDQQGQPIQYDQEGQPIQYNQPVEPIEYDENNQPVQYDENGQPIQYDSTGQAIQYDENGQPIQYDPNTQPIQYDENGQPIQYDSTGQPIQYDENGQPIQYDPDMQPVQYDENGQPIPSTQLDENGQPIYYDQSGQPIAYDENGQIIQYDESGQPVQYDENSQPVQYDENGQPVYQYPQYDETGQVLQQYDDNGQPLQYNEQGQYDENGQAVSNYPAENPTEQNKEDKTFGEVVLPENVDNTLEDKDAATVNQTGKSKVLEMLDTDTESLQQNVSKVSDSDFSISQ
uniref:Mesocentin-like isoform X2 n=1 Tax=Diabrotica virgifera virgifera TaxID=50390 RepID=A0A6P7GNA1_DIAVI